MQGVEFDPKVLAKGLEEIYRGMNVRDEIQNDIFRETLRLFNEAASKGLSDSTWSDDVPDEFINQLRTNNAIWTAFRTHRMQNDIASQLLDENGNLKPFERWVKDIKGMTNHYVRQWLKTEYNTAILRAHQAADWKHFEAEQDVFPNIRWMPTTSPQQDLVHAQYWRNKLTLPVNHPFWKEHRPGDRWNCKCSLEQTDEPTNDEVIKDFKPVAQQAGLENNPGEDGKLFSDSHPYVAKAYPGAKGAVASVVGRTKRTKEQEEVIRQAWEDRKESYKKAKEWAEKIPYQEMYNDALEAAIKVLRLDKDFPLPKIELKDLGGKTKLGIVGGNYSSSTDTLRLNINKAMVKEWSKLKGANEGWNAQTNIVLHELSHAVHYRINPTDYNNAPHRSIRLLDKKIVRKELSEYAATNMAEYNAEIISSILSGKQYRDPLLAESIISSSKSKLAEELVRMGRDMSTSGIRQRKQENRAASKKLTEWYKTNLPTKELNGAPTKRFVIETQYGDTVIVNKKFYNKIISSYTDDIFYQERLEIAKLSHINLKTAKLITRMETPRHDSHKDAEETFKVYEREVDGVVYQFKTKVNKDGEYLYYLRRK